MGWYDNNPYYNASELGLEMHAIEEEDLSYEFNILAFWLDPQTGRVYTASDSGCSCPTPFENLAANTRDETIMGLEQVGSFEQAEQIFNSWNNAPWRARKSLVTQKDATDYLDELKKWFKK